MFPREGLTPPALRECPCPAADQLWKALLADLHSPGEHARLSCASAPSCPGFGLPVVHIEGLSQPGVRLKLGVFGGLHGDEPASSLGVLAFLSDLLRTPDLIAGYEVVAVPFCNPAGLRYRTRENALGVDLNREFWKASSQWEIAVLEGLLQQHRFDGVYTLHADDTAEGCYGYTWGRVLNEELLKPALAAAARVIPTDGRPLIDGFAADRGMLSSCFPGVLAPPPAAAPRPFEIIFETPALAPLATQVEAQRLALHSVLRSHRALVSFGAGI